MGLLSEIKSLEAKYVAIYVVAFLGTVASGFLIIFHFRPELIEKYDILKLVFLSLSLTLPLVLINLLNIAISNIEKNNDLTLPLLLALLLNIIAIYPPLFICYWCLLGFKWFLCMVALIEVIIFFASLIIQKFDEPSKTP